MITNTLKDTWGYAKAKLKQKFSSLTDNDLAYIQGCEDEMIGQIQRKTGVPREDILRILREECGCNC